MSKSLAVVVVVVMFACGSVMAADPYDTSPSWSPDGQFIYFYSYRHENGELYRMRPDGSQQTRLTHSDYNEWWMHALADGKTLLVASDKDSGESYGGSNLYLFDIESGDMMNVTRVAPGRWAALASVSNEAGVAIYSISEGFGARAESELWILDLESRESTPFADDPAHHNIFPSISKDGAVVSYMSVRNGETGLFVNNLEGTNERQVLKVDGAPAAAKLSPDGSQIAITAGAWMWGSGEDGGSAGDRDVYVAATDGSEIVRVTKSTASDHSPSWSPDGKTLTFTSYRFGPGEIFAIRPDGTGEANLTRTSMPKP